jgi:hypothetical protein
MGFRQEAVGWLARVAGILWLSSGVHAADPLAVSDATYGPEGVAPYSVFGPVVPIDKIPPGVRERVRRVVEHPTVSTRGPAEAFRGKPDLYQWFLDHPDRAVQTWRRLGAKCMMITDRGNGRFGWADGQGSDVHWDTVYRDDRCRIWYAEGKSKPTALLPAVPIHAVVVLHYGEIKDGLGRSLLHHQADLYLLTDSTTARLLARLLGPSVPRLAQECVAQLELFFSALVWYLDRHPERAEGLLGACLKPELDYHHQVVAVDDLFIRN